MEEMEKPVVPVAKAKVPPKLPGSSPPKPPPTVTYKTAAKKSLTDITASSKEDLEADIKTSINRTFKEDYIQGQIIKNLVDLSAEESAHPAMYYAFIIKKNKEQVVPYLPSDFIKLVDESKVLPTKTVQMQWVNSENFKFHDQYIKDASKVNLTPTQYGDLTKRVIKDIDEKFAVFGPALYLTALNYDYGSYQSLKKELVDKITGSIMRDANYNATEQIKLWQDEVVFKPILNYIDHIVFKQMEKGEGTVEAYEKRFVKHFNKMRKEAHETPNQLGQWKNIMQMFDNFNLSGQYMEVMKRAAGKETYKKAKKK